MRHVVWDWNGTLLDDLEVVVESVNVAISVLDGPEVTVTSYRDHYTRPVKVFYEGLLGRPITEEEWHLLNNTYHEAYYGSVHRAPLARDALAALDVVEENGHEQSLLSMTPQHRLETIVGRRGLAERLHPVTGLPAQTGGLKTEHMEFHLEKQGLSGRQVVVIGDTPDDVVAADAVGAPAILYDGGSHHRPHLDEVGVPVAGSLLEALEIAFSL